MKFRKLSPEELQYISTLDWNELMIHLERKFGVEYKNQMEKNLVKVIEKRMKQDYKNKEDLK